MKRSISRIMVSLLLTHQLLHGQNIDRIASAIDPGEQVRVAGTIPPAPTDYIDRGPTDSSTVLHSLTLNIRLSPAQEAELDALIMAQMKRGSKNYHQWLKREEYAARFGLTPSDLSKITQWMESQGLHVDRVGNSRNAIHFSGSISQIEAALQTEIHSFSAPDGGINYSNTREISIPRALSGVIAGVGGLQVARPHAGHLLRVDRPLVGGDRKDNNPLFTFPTTNDGNHFLVPGDIAAIYGINPLYMNGYTGTGQQIAVAGGSSLLINDISAFRNAAGLPVQTITQECISTSVPCTGDSATSTDLLAEADLDVEWVGAIAQNATINYIYAAADDPTLNSSNALLYAVQDYSVNGNVVPIINYSFGICEQLVSPSTIAAFEIVMKQAATQGQTIFAGAGDSGSADCDYAAPPTIVASATHGLAVNYPASSVYVLAVGGTEFTADGPPGQSLSSTYWNTSNSVNPETNLVYSVTGYIPESAWNDSTYNIQNGGGIEAGGGGYSTLFDRPIWQAGISSPLVANNGPRDVPDIAMAASAMHDPYMICTNGSCTNGFYSAGGDITLGGGTSAATPVAAGIFSLIEQRTGERYGVVASELYPIASNPDSYSSPGGAAAPFNIIQPPLFAGGQGNDVPCTTGSPNCGPGVLVSSLQPLQYAFELSGTYVYNLAVGLGSINAANLANVLSSMSVAPPAKTFTLSGSPVTVAGSGTKTTTIAITPVSGYEGTVDLSCAITTSPSGASDAPTCNVASPTTINSSSAGSAILTIATGNNVARNDFRLVPNQRSQWFFVRGGAALATILVCWIPRRRCKAFSVLVVLTIVAVVGCGGSGSSSSSSGGSTQSPSPTTTPGSYVVTVTGADSLTSSITSSVVISVTVQ